MICFLLLTTHNFPFGQHPLISFDIVRLVDVQKCLSILSFAGYSQQIPSLAVWTVAIEGPGKIELAPEPSRPA